MGVAYIEERVAWTKDNRGSDDCTFRIGSQECFLALFFGSPTEFGVSLTTPSLSATPHKRSSVVSCVDD